MRLNTLSPSVGAKHTRKRVGRGIGSGFGKTCGRGHKGQKSRAGGFHKVGFEGGQMPLQRRLPKRGFTSLRKGVEVITLYELAKADAEIIDIAALQAVGVVSKSTDSVRVILSGEIARPCVVRGLHVTAGARRAIEAQGGSIAE